jgi:uncharacterized membrane protein
MSDLKPARSRTYKWIAIGLAVFGVLVLVIAFSIYRHQFAGEYSPSGSDWGLFGDYIGGVAGTFLAFATLIALVVALVVQATELEETRRALRDQAAATIQQVKDMRLYEQRRVQPLIRAEWQRLRRTTEGVCWGIRNVGLGPCILDGIELYEGNERIGVHGFDDVLQVMDLWSLVIANVLRDEKPMDDRVTFESVHTLKRALGVGEWQPLVTVHIFHGEDVDDVMALLDGRIRPVIHFRSLAGVSLTTLNQYDELIRESGVTEFLANDRGD